MSGIICLIQYFRNILKLTGSLQETFNMDAVVN